MLGALYQLAVADVPQKRRERNRQTPDEVPGFIDGLVLTGDLTAHRHDRGAARIRSHRPTRGGLASLRPGDVTAELTFRLAGLKWRLAPIREANRNHLRSAAATVFYRN